MSGMCERVFFSILNTLEQNLYHISNQWFKPYLNWYGNLVILRNWLQYVVYFLSLHWAVQTTTLHIRVLKNELYLVILNIIVYFLGLQSVPWVTKQPSRRVADVQCDSTHYCPSGNTCCRLASGQWGCCPVPNAVCCNDHQHCCPSGYTCQSGSGNCVRGLSTVPWMTKEPAISKAVDVENVQCDASHECPSGNTCCKLASGQWGCCPVPNAVCCDDHEHCCPSGFTCQTGSGHCVRGLTAVPWMAKEPAISKAVTVENVQCDSTHYCPSGNTCCKLASGQWGCCPVPNAVCCDDHQHCCPSGYTCQTGTGECVRGLVRVPWKSKELAIVDQTSVNMVQCDSTHYCPDGNTCCRLASGQWGCCPVPNAVCCNDHEHCCPSGYTCQTGTGECVRGLVRIPWKSKEQAIVAQALVNMVQCDSTHYCPDGNTCCRLASGQWGCCPVPNAVCCDDHQHCCPSGYTCQTGTGECIRGRNSSYLSTYGFPILELQTQ